MADHIFASEVYGKLHHNLVFFFLLKGTEYFSMAH